MDAGSRQISTLNQPSGRSPARIAPLAEADDTSRREGVRLGAYLWSRVPLNNALKHERVSFFDGVDPLADVIVIDVTRCA